MSSTEPSGQSLVRSEHLTKLAIVYVRQSTPEQVRANVGSTHAQRDLTELPRRWGWPEHLIKVIDDDLGLSGKFSHNRAGFREMLDLTATGRVGLVVVQDPSRLSRAPLDWERFLDTARRFGVLISTDDRVFDPDSAKLPELFGLRIKTLLAWYENEDRAARFRKARFAKAHRGSAVSRPPNGYIESVKGKWIKDTEPAIREAVDRVFRLALEYRSLRETHRNYRKRYGVFPMRRRGAIEWFPLNSSTLSAMLANPNYCGDYVFNRRRSMVHPTTGKQRLVTRPRSEWVISRDHHEPYISRQEWEALQESLAAARPAVRPPRGKGPAIAQGLIRCGLCSRWLLTQYQSRDRRTRSMCYVCRRKDRWDRWTIHNRVNARVIDRFLVDQILRVVTPPQLEDALTAIQRKRNERGGTERALSLRVRHLEDSVREAKRRYTHVDPDNHHVRVQLEADLETLLCQLHEAKLQIDTFDAQTEPRLSPEDAKELLEFARQLPLLWNAETTTNEDRKRLIRTALSEVIIRDVSKESNTARARVARRLKRNPWHPHTHRAQESRGRVATRRA
jgi:DNA invertase Pin-like site-specific DNA recombinase